MEVEPGVTEPRYHGGATASALLVYPDNTYPAMTSSGGFSRMGLESDRYDTRGMTGGTAAADFVFPLDGVQSGSIPAGLSRNRFKELEAENPGRPTGSHRMFEHMGSKGDQRGGLNLP